jgi:protein TonB
MMPSKSRVVSSEEAEPQPASAVVLQFSAAPSYAVRPAAALASVASGQRGHLIDAAPDTCSDPLVKPEEGSRRNGDPALDSRLRGNERVGPPVTSITSAPAAGERPTLFTPRVREWLRVTLIISFAIHAIVYLAFQLRFHDDLERAAGAAAALSSEGTIAIPIDVVVEAMLPSAPAPTDATPEDAKPEEIDELMPTPPDPAPVVIPKKLTNIELPAPPEPAPLALPAPEQAEKLTLPEEQTAPSRPVEPAPVPRAPAAVKVEQASIPEKREQTKKTARSAPSAAASPSRAAASNSNGASGAGGAADARGSAAISSYQAQVLAHLTRHRVYPQEARERGVTGIARVQFTLARDGRVLLASLIGGSGERLLESAALDMVRRASPFPPFPAGVAQARMDFAAPIRFDLR